VRNIVESFISKVGKHDLYEELINNKDIEYEKNLTPKLIKERLDEYIVGQEHVKNALAISLSII
jgi:ATP-dependent protease Clp ATPase subunit